MMTFPKLLERIKPYTVGWTQSDFKNLMTEPLITEFYRKVKLNENAEWLRKAEKEVFFIVNDDQWKWSRVQQAHIRLSFVGPEESPVVSIDYY